MAGLYQRAMRIGMAAFLLLPLAAFAQTLPPASQVAGQITLGWNLGNSMEAQCGETAWGNPMVNQQLINAVRAAGFNAIRIPGGWDCHANQTTMTIDAAWMARVKEVVDYAHGQGMTVILNIHWDGGWLEEHPLYSHQQAVNQKQRAYWTQIANTFKNYNERLLFAGTNEVHADYGTPTTEHITVQQSYNQSFVDAVRATGGNNASRTLVVQTYNTNMWHGLNYFSIPTDTIANRLIVEVHHYDPYDYTLNPSGSCLYWGAPYPSQSACTWAQEAYHDDLFGQVRAKWVAQGIPVIIGEYGVAMRPNLNLPSREYYLEYVNRAAAANGIKTFYWDNGVSPSQTNGFALFNRSNGAVIDQGALDAVKRGAGVGNPNLFTLTVTKAGTGSGTVTSSPSGINCGSTCSGNYSSGTSVTLTATAASGSTFAGWGGACTGTATCTVSMTAVRSVTATFNTSGTGTNCSNPITFSGNTGGFNTTGAVCYRTNATINGWGCYNFDGRTLTVGGQARTCGQMPLTRSSDGYYYFSVSGGTYPWAGMYAW
jgi:aryl-phospho-beta-D-glucosidase BglC (GH1 family)